MRGPGTPTLDQLALLLAVVDAGGLVAAARQTGRAASAVSYAIDQLELLLGLPLFERGKRRTPVLTAAGVAVVAEARAVIGDVARLRAKVTGLLGGLEAEVVLAVEVVLPTPRLVAALQDFAREFPTVGLRLHVEAMGAIVDLVLGGRATIGVAGPIAAEVPGLTRRDAGGVTMLPVAAPGHPLTAGPMPPGAPRDHIQLVLTDRSKLTEGKDFGVIGLKTWRLGDLGAKHALLLAGAGWGNMPEPMVAADLAAGRLVRLDLAEWSGAVYPLAVVHRTGDPPGPAGRWLIDRLVAG